MRKAREVFDMYDCDLHGAVLDEWRRQKLVYHLELRHMWVGGVDNRRRSVNHLSTV